MQRIPTLHELKLAARVERARALFGPGGYLPAVCRGEQAATEDGKRTSVSGHPERHPTLAATVATVDKAADATRENRNKEEEPSLSTWTVFDNTTSYLSASESETQRQRQRQQTGDRKTSEMSATTDRQLQPRRRDTNESQREDNELSFSAASTAYSRDSDRSATGDRGQRDCQTGKELSVRPHQQHSTPEPNTPPTPTRRLDIDEGAARRAALVVAQQGGVSTTVTLTIIGGRPRGKGLTNLEQNGKVPSCERSSCCTFNLAPSRNCATNTQAIIDSYHRPSVGVDCVVCWALW